MDEQNNSQTLLISCLLLAVFGVVVIVLIALTIGIILPAAFPAAPVVSAAPPTFTHAAAPDPAAYTWDVVATDFDNPVFLTHAGDGTGRLFVGEQGGYIWILYPDGTQSPRPFLEMPLLTSPDVMRGTYSERGLLSMAFDPDYANTGSFYISYTDRVGDSVVARLRVSPASPDRADHGSAEIILRQPQPYYDHNGGQIAFGPDGYLYIGFGDGGSIDDPQINAQNPASWLGKLLRIDVRGHATYAVPPDNPFVSDPAYLPEIWSVGFRNPWRFSFDRATGDLYIADVGQWTWEEWNFQLAGMGGRNYGWNLFEANLQRAETVPAELTLQAPAIAYDHSEGCSITGGYVYRGALLPDMNGRYLYGDYCNGRVWTAWRDRSTGAWQAAVLHDTGHNISSFGEDEAGEVYLVDYKGTIYRLAAAPGSQP